MRAEDFERLQQLLVSRAGFRLARDRMNLAEHRLGPIARREGYAAVEVLLGELWSRPVASLGWAVIEAMLNPETWFNRDRPTFDTFARELLPAIARARPDGVVRVWSAGCSTGQEAYSLAMAGLEAGVEVRVFGTDLVQSALDRAAAGAFTAFEIQRGLSAQRMLRWFEREDDQWIARPALRERVRFARANLLDDPTDGSRYDIIFCRHVLSDMEPARRSRVIDGLEQRLVDDGCLFLGPDERAEGDSVAFRPVNGRRGLYVKTPAAVRRAA